MVAKITTPGSISRALNYNEKKVQEGKAVCLQAVNFLLDTDRLNFYQKLERFEKQIALNERAKTNTLHISLNFDPSEKLEKEKLISIAETYMQKIGFGKQPYLIYEHHDAGHPHMHIVTTNIKADGKRIDTFNIGRNQSTQARKEIEISFGLKKAEQQKQKPNEEIKPLNAQRIVYGKAETKRGITNVLDAVLNQFKYTSLAELNAVLKLYNIVADRGKEEGRIYKNQGLLYRVLDQHGNKIGVPIKASSIYSKPTLSFLEKKFKENESLRQEHKKHLKTSIDWIMIMPKKGLEKFKEALQKERIYLVVRQNEQGVIYGLTYIDFTTKCVFNGSDIGKEYSAKIILEKCGESQQLSLVSKNNISRKTKQNRSMQLERESKLSFDQHLVLGKVWEELVNPIEQYNTIPYQLRKRKKKKIIR